MLFSTMTCTSPKCPSETKSNQEALLARMYGLLQELRPSNLRHLRTNPHPGRGLDAALDFSKAFCVLIGRALGYLASQQWTFVSSEARREIDSRAPKE